MEVNVELPLPPSLEHTIEVDTLIKDKLLLEHKASSAYFHHNNAWWTRCSAQIWNEVNNIPFPFNSIALLIKIIPPDRGF